jgi:hypothetical protein
MELAIEGEGPKAIQEISDLRDWLHDARLREVKSLEQQKRAPKEGEQGAELLQAIEVILAAPAVLVLVGCIRDYIIASRPSMTITLKTKSGMLRIDARNPPPSEELKRMAQTLTPS